MSVGSRIMRAGTEATRLLDADRVVPTTGLASLSTVLLRGEVPISDEAFEDNIEKDRMADTIMTMVAEAVGRDVEELLAGRGARVNIRIPVIPGFNMHAENIERTAEFIASLELKIWIGLPKQLSSIA